ncbi:peptidylprolyl isomerase [Paenibacillus turpanensis]|uniref:peptidylprolyl isomerase n=1 Tax=Paenibacillus turpanensis TaxID=2689078 RepID=UPI00140AFCF8|nr:peptidylprolyl isomerase [Paenibacillus turpanensis]
MINEVDTAMEQIGDATVIRVNDKVVTLRELIRQAKLWNGLTAVAEGIKHKVLECWAEELGLEADTEDLQSELTVFRKKNRLFTVEQTNEWLKQQGISLRELTDELKPRVLRRMLMDVCVTNEEIERSFQEHILEYDRAELSVIVMPEFGQAQEMRFRIEEGEDFHMLARTYSQDAGSAKAGGYIGLLGRKDLEASVASAIFGADDGEIVGPLEGKYGFSVFLIEKQFPAALDEEVRFEVRERLFQERLEAYQSKLRIQEDIWSL